MKIYFARPINLYKTPQDERDLQLLTQLGFDIVNPDKAELAKRYQEEGMDVFLQAVKDCDMVAFRACPDLKITAGVYKEIMQAVELKKPVIELPTLISTRVMSVEDTRAYLTYIGNR
jgi:hypothetical protein